MKKTPPNGVTGPNNLAFPIPINSLVLKRYKEPENNRIPTKKQINENRIDAFFAREKVDKKSSAKV